MFVDIVVVDNQVLFKIDCVLFYLCILDGIYLDIFRIILILYKIEFVLDIKKLSELIDWVYLLLCEEKINIVCMQMMEFGMIEILLSFFELGKVREEIELVEFIGDLLKILFNFKYMLDVLKVVESEQLMIVFIGVMSLIILKLLDDSYSFYVILFYWMIN